MTSDIHISVCICTYKRPDLLARLIKSLRHQETGGIFEYSIVVTDNDEDESARSVVVECSDGFPFDLRYCVEPRRSISHARNTCIANAKGNYIAIIDDDEVAEPTWLLNMHKAMVEYNADGVLGPVKPYFDDPPPQWVIRGQFCERPEHPRGYSMKWNECRTGNVLLDRKILQGLDPIFAPAFGTGGSDVDFFRRMIGAGYQFVWCNEAPVHEIVPPHRTTRSYMLKRGLLRGGNASKYPIGKLKGIIKAMIALPVYTAMLPFLLVAGQHHFMKFMISWCDHLGRIAGSIGIYLVKSRPK